MIGRILITLRSRVTGQGIQPCTLESAGFAKGDAITRPDSGKSLRIFA